MLAVIIFVASVCNFLWTTVQLPTAIGHGEVRVYRGTGVSRGVRRTTWERSLKNWELHISCFEELLGGENVLGLVPASLPDTLGYACTFYAPTSPPLSEAFYTDAVRRVNLLTLTFALYFPAFERLRSTLSLA